MNWSLLSRASHASHANTDRRMIGDAVCNLSERIDRLTQEIALNRLQNSKLLEAHLERMEEKLDRLIKHLCSEHDAKVGTLYDLVSQQQKRLEAMLTKPKPKNVAARLGEGAD